MILINSEDYFLPSSALQYAVAHPETSPPVLWTGKMHSWTGWTGKKNGVFGSHLGPFYI